MSELDYATGQLSVYLKLKRQVKELEADISRLNHDIASRIQALDILQTQVADTVFEMKELEKRIKAMEEAAEHEIDSC